MSDDIFTEHIEQVAINAFREVLDGFYEAISHIITYGSYHKLQTVCNDQVQMRNNGECTPGGLKGQRCMRDLFEGKEVFCESQLKESVNSIKKQLESCDIYTSNNTILKITQDFRMVQ